MAGVVKNVQQVRETLLRRHKAERKELRKRCNEALQGTKGAERDTAEAANAAQRQEQEARHAAEVAAFEQALLDAAKDQGAADVSEVDVATAASIAAATVGVEDLAVEEDDGKTRAQKRREKKKEQEKAAEQQRAERRAQAGPTQRDQEIELLRKRLDPMGLEIKEMEADGHCLYRAIADQLQQHGASSIGEGKEPHLLLRTMCAQFMRENRPMFEPFVAADDSNENGDNAATFDHYLDRLKNTADWGGQLELRALAGALKTPIEVIAAQGDPVVMGDDVSGDPLLVTFHRHYLTLGEHYNSVHPKSQGSQTQQQAPTPQTQAPAQ